jgi:hypothetical protein
MFRKSVSPHEAKWAGPKAVVDASGLEGMPLAVTLLMIAEMIQAEVPAALCMYRPRSPRKTAEYAAVWQEATIARLERHFGMEYVDGSIRDWTAMLEQRLSLVPGTDDWRSHRRVVRHVYQIVRDRIIKRLRPGPDPGMAAV